MSSATDQIQAFTEQEYKYGFVTEIETDSVPAGLNEDVIRLISAKKGEPDFMLQWRLESLSALDADDRAELGERALRSHRLPEHRVLFSAERRGKPSEEPG